MAYKSRKKNKEQTRLRKLLRKYGIIDFTSFLEYWRKKTIED
jgi:hypothetical protein